MRNTVVRLTSLTLKNIKNVKNGTIIMPRADEKNLKAAKQRFQEFMDKMVQVKQQLLMHFIFCRIL